MKPVIVTRFQDPQSVSAPLTGGKGANLAKMAQAGFPVPDGFCITTNAYSHVLKTNHLDEVILKYTKDIRLDRPEEIADQTAIIRQFIQAAEFPPDLTCMILDAWNACGETFNYAVRSSATAEDLPFTSFAGQQDTYLNVHGETALLEAIRNCWASLYTERAVTYRLQNHFEHEQIQIAVVVQQMVDSELSGILFTADPVSNHHNIISINASYGLGEALVSGLVNPDLIRVEKDSLKILQYETSKKTMMIVPTGQGTQKIAVSEEKSSQPALTNFQVIQLAELGKQVEKYYGVPQDIEWAIHGEQLFLLQTRPITSLFPIPSPKPTNKDMHVYFSLGHMQMNTAPISPMGISIIQLYVPLDHPPHAINSSPLATTAGGRLYVDITALINNKTGQHLLPKILETFEPVAANQIYQIIASSEFQTRNAKASTRI